MTTVGRAIAAYEATLLRGDSRFDKAMFGGDKNALSAAGMARLRYLHLEGRLRRLPQHRKRRGAFHRSVLAQYGRRVPTRRRRRQGRRCNWRQAS